MTQPPAPPQPPWRPFRRNRRGLCGLPGDGGRCAAAVKEADSMVLGGRRRQPGEHVGYKLLAGARLQRLVPPALEADGRSRLAAHAPPAGRAEEMGRPDLDVDPRV